MKEELINEFFDQYQPERSKREDSFEFLKTACIDEIFDDKGEMRCSEHCGNTVS